MSKKRTKRCAHKQARRIDASHATIAYECVACLARGVRSLGRSEDKEPGVKVEMRAAAISACVEERMSSTEAVGYGQHPLFNVRRGIMSNKHAAGWLASELDEHDDLESRDAHAWPWNPMRPVAGQYEVWLRAADLEASTPSRHLDGWTEHGKDDECTMAGAAAAAVTLDPVPDPNALAAVAIVGLEPPWKRLRMLAEAAALQRDPKHCDDYIDDESAPAPLRAYLKRARSPGHGMLTSDPFPRLFADYDGKRVRVVMASRLGDVGITDDITADITYQKRVNVEDLSNFGDAPDSTEPGNG